jgi:hypothetical protein
LLTSRSQGTTNTERERVFYFSILFDCLRVVNHGRKKGHQGGDRGTKTTEDPPGWDKVSRPCSLLAGTAWEQIHEYASEWREV